MGPGRLLAVALPAPFVPQSTASLDLTLPFHLCVNVGLRGLLAVALPLVPQSTRLLIRQHCPESCVPQFPVSAPRAGLDECFFFISLVVGLLCGSIFCQFWLFFVFKLLLSFWLCEEVQCVYLCLHLGCFFLVFWGRLELLWITLLRLFLLCATDFVLLYFHFNLSRGIYCFLPWSHC